MSARETFVASDATLGTAKVVRREVCCLSAFGIAETQNSTLWNMGIQRSIGVKYLSISDKETERKKQPKDREETPHPKRRKK